MTPIWRGSVPRWVGMARKRVRKKQEQDALQGDLLRDQVVPDVAQAAAPPELEGPHPEAPEVPAEPDAPLERWAKAVGQLKPHRPRAGPTTMSAAGHVSARDHSAAALARPAGEPLARARDMVRQGRVQEAIELYLGILTVNPSNLKAHNNLGVLLDELKQFEAALEHFEAAERLAPENVEVLVNYASTLTSLARYEEAEGLLRRAQRLAADDVRARLGVGILYFRRGLYAQAEAELRWVLTKDEANGGAHYYRGEALNRLGRFDEAAVELARAVELIPNDPRPYYTLGHLYDRQRRLEDAAEMYRQARRLQAR